MVSIKNEKVRQVLGYLADRNRSQCGCWISISDVQGALGIERSEVEEACRSLGSDDLAELMGGFPLRRTSDRFTLVRLTGKGAELADDPDPAAEQSGGGPDQ